MVMTFKYIRKTCPLLLIVLLAVPLMAAAKWERVVVERPDGKRFSFITEIADTDITRQRGLMYRKSLPKNRAMLFVFYREQYVSMWMKNTYIPLDMLFIDKDGVVVDIFEKATPMSTDIIDSDVPVRYVLEIAAGRVEALGLARGDKIQRYKLKRKKKIKS